MYKAEQTRPNSCQFLHPPTLSPISRIKRPLSHSYLRAIAADSNQESPGKHTRLSIHSDSLHRRLSLIHPSLSRQRRYTRQLRPVPSRRARGARRCGVHVQTRARSKGRARHQFGALVAFCSAALRGHDAWQVAYAQFLAEHRKVSLNPFLKFLRAAPLTSRRRISLFYICIIVIIIIVILHFGSFEFSALRTLLPPTTCSSALWKWTAWTQALLVVMWSF